jgi:hypothetical protein
MSGQKTNSRTTRDGEALRLLRGDSGLPLLREKVGETLLQEYLPTKPGVVRSKSAQASSSSPPSGHVHHHHHPHTPSHHHTPSHMHRNDAPAAEESSEARLCVEPICSVTRCHSRRRMGRKADEVAAQEFDDHDVA